MLERREVLDGSVSVLLTGAGDLVITGDGAANHLRINGSGSAITVQGFALTGGSATVVNGIANGTVTFRGVRNLEVHLGGGDDFLVLGNILPGVVVPGDVFLDLGDGNDRITSNGTSVGGGLAIQTGSGDDTVILAGNVVGGATKIHLGVGDDELRLIAGIFSGAFVANGAGGTDAFNLIGVPTFAQPPDLTQFEA
jgi:hypothetical protein